MDLNILFQLPDQLDQRSYEILIREMIHKSGSGFDYLKFKQSVSSLMQMNMDEVTAIRSAYMTASTIGLTADKLDKTAENSILILQQEKQQFTKALDKQIKERIESKQDEVENLKAKIQKNQQLLQQLTAEIQDLEEKINATSSELKESEERIRQSRERFEAVYTFLLESIHQDREKFKSIL
jgi:septal ring factor EnvC (AmiA/AmiB activator)